MTSIRFLFIKQALQIAILSSSILFVLIQLLVLVIPKFHLSFVESLLFISITFLVVLCTGFWFGNKTGSDMSTRMTDILAGFGQLQNGKNARLVVQIEDEIGLVEDGFNDLSDQMNGQLKSLQRLVDQNVVMIKQAEQAAMTEERQKIARELHDAVSQQLFALSMLASAAERSALKAPEQAVPLIQKMAILSVKTLNEMRALLLHLRPIDLQNKSLYTAISELINELESRTDVVFEFRFSKDSCLSQGSEEHVYRMVQEVLANCLRHAEAQQVKIVGEVAEKQFILRIRDDGNGFDPAKKKQTSYGLITIRERCEEIGGTARLFAREGEGTEWTFHIPCQAIKGGLSSEIDSTWHNG
ncbi:MAG: sensor histidine kinase [Paenisporosarcina sp.]|nr:sensor histidine kinase [Paenisporosarcina sp.]